MCLLASSIIQPLLPAAAAIMLCLLLALKVKRKGARATSIYRRRGRDAQVIRHMRRKPEWMLESILYLAAHLPDASIRRITDTFNLIHGPAHTVGKTWVHDKLRGHRFDIENLRREIRRRKPAPVSVNHVWALDMTGTTDAAGVQQSILGIIDHGSRRVVRLRALVNKRSWTLLGHLCLAIGQFGKPRSLRTDNERVFTSVLFRTVLGLMGIRHQRTRPGSPWQNGRIERFWGTLKPALRQLAVAHRVGLQAALNEFALFYNHVRPHRHLGGLTPAMAWQGQTHADLRGRPVRKVVHVSALAGLLQGFYVRR